MSAQDTPHSLDLISIPLSGSGSFICFLPSKQELSTPAISTFPHFPLTSQLTLIKISSSSLSRHYLSSPIQQMVPLSTQGLQPETVVLTLSPPSTSNLPAYLLGPICKLYPKMHLAPFSAQPLLKNSLQTTSSLDYSLLPLLPPYLQPILQPVAKVNFTKKKTSSHTLSDPPPHWSLDYVSKPHLVSPESLHVPAVWPVPSHTSVLHLPVIGPGRCC